MKTVCSVLDGLLGGRGRPSVCASVFRTRGCKQVSDSTFYECCCAGRMGVSVVVVFGPLISVRASGQHAQGECGGGEGAPTDIRGGFVRCGVASVGAQPRCCLKGCSPGIGQEGFLSCLMNVPAMHQALELCCLARMVAVRARAPTVQIHLCVPCFCQRCAVGCILGCHVILSTRI